MIGITCDLIEDLREQYAIEKGHPTESTITSSKCEQPF